MKMEQKAEKVACMFLGTESTRQRVSLCIHSKPSQWFWRPCYPKVSIYRPTFSNMYPIYSNVRRAQSGSESVVRKRNFLGVDFRKSIVSRRGWGF